MVVKYFMKIIYLKNDILVLPEVATYMSEEWGLYPPEMYINMLYKCLNINKIPLTIIAKSENNDLMGFASLVEFDMEEHKELTPWINGVFVAPKYRKQGIGRTLVKKLENISVNMGYPQIYLFTIDKQRFYSKLSWIKLMDSKYLDKDVTIMKRIL